MITVKKETLERIKDWKDNSLYVLTDFDRTITVGNSETKELIKNRPNIILLGEIKMAKKETRDLL